MYIILTQSVPIEDSNYRIAADNLMVDVILYLQGNWQPQGGLACGQVNGRFVVMQAMMREEEAEPDA